MEEWSILLKKAGRSSFLGKVDTRWKILRENNGLISISQNTAKWISSGIGLSFIVVCIVVFYLQVPNVIKTRPWKVLGWLIVVCACSYIIIDLALIRKISWRKGYSNLEFKWGIYPFLKTIQLDSKGLTVKFRGFARENMESNSKQVELFLISPKSEMKDICLAKGKKIDFLLPAFDSISGYLEEIKNQ